MTNDARAQTALLAALLALAVLYTLWAAAALVVPLLLSLLLYLVLSPVVSRLHRLGAPRVVATVVLTVAIAGGLGLAIWALASPATTWVSRAPEAFGLLRAELAEVIRPLQRLEDAAEVAGAAAGVEGERPVQQVTLQDNEVQTALLAGTTQFVGSLALVATVSIFLLATGGRTGRDMAGLLPSFAAAKRALGVGNAVRRELSHYLLTIALINTALGFATAAVLWFMGLPDAALWGAMMGLLNFIPYLGPAATLGAVFLAGVIHFDDVGRALVPPLAVFGLNLLEGGLVTPALVAMRLSLSPVMVIVSLAVWGWLWGIAGLLVAVPLLAMAKVVCDHVPGLEPLGRVLGERRAEDPEAVHHSWWPVRAARRARRRLAAWAGRRGWRREPAPVLKASLRPRAKRSLARGASR